MSTEEKNVQKTKEAAAELRDGLSQVMGRDLTVG